MSKSASDAVFEQFYRENQGRVRRYAAMVARMHGIPRDLLPDCLQSAWLEASVALGYWRADGGKTAFNWCAGPMRRAIVRCHRLSLGNRPYGVEKPHRYAELKPHHAHMPAENIAERIDLHRALAADPRPQQVVRLIMTALSVTTGAEIARESGVKKQTVSEHLIKAKLRLKAQLTA